MDLYKILENTFRNIYILDVVSLTWLFFEKTSKTFRLEKEVLKTEMSHYDFDYNFYKDEKDEWLNFVKQDVFCTAFSYARYCETMVENTGLPMKDGSSAPGLGWKYFRSVKTEEDDTIYTYYNKYMR